MVGDRLSVMVERLESRAYLSIAYASPVEAGGIAPSGGIVTGDINKDGIPDVVVSGSAASSTPAVGVYIGNGDGTFQAPVILHPGNHPFGVWVADFNNDTKP